MQASGRRPRRPINVLPRALTTRPEAWTGCVLSVALNRTSFDRLSISRSVFSAVRYHSYCSRRRSASVPTVSRRWYVRLAQSTFQALRHCATHLTVIQFLQRSVRSLCIWHRALLCLSEPWAELFRAVRLLKHPGPSRGRRSSSHM